jgi:predicted MFS family arabinose efflux permease
VPQFSCSRSFGSLIPRGTPDRRARFDVTTVLAGYGDLLANRSLTLIYGFQTLYVVCAFGTGAYLSALMAARGFAPEEIAVVFATAGGAFVVSSVVSGEILGKVKLDLRFVAILMAFLVCLTRGLVYILPLSVTATIVLIGVASLADGVIANTLRALAVSYQVRDRALSMSFFAASDNVGQAFGGIICGFVLSIGGYPAIGALVFVVFVLSAGLPLASRQLIRVRSGALVR